MIVPYCRLEAILELAAAGTCRYPAAADFVGPAT